MYCLSINQKTTILQALTEGCSLRSIERMTGHHRDTIMRLLVSAGEKAKFVMNAKMRNIQNACLEVDEIWTYVGKKKKNLRPGDSRKLGSHYIFVAIDRNTKLVPYFRIGQRDFLSAAEFMFVLETKISGRAQIVTDGLGVYIDAVRLTFGENVDFGQLVKVYRKDYTPMREGYSPIDFVTTKCSVIRGRPRHISTSIVERNNLTMRMSSRRLTRLTNGFSKKYENLEAALYLHFAYYNLCRIHGSLRMTPAMAAGITDHIWSIEEILNFPN